MGGVLAGLLALLPLSWCGGSANNTVDLGAGDGGGKLCCGKPGDNGNSLGVGKYCITGNECDKGTVGTLRTICSATAEPQRMANFCTLPCALDGGTAQCGEGATCIADSTQPGLSGCVPTACVNNLPPGCTL
jgi:hypothetical protein